jgi:hypothetical protein
MRKVGGGEKGKVRVGMESKEKTLQKKAKK